MPRFEQRGVSSDGLTITLHRLQDGFYGASGRDHVDSTRLINVLFVDTEGSSLDSSSQLIEIAAVLASVDADNGEILNVVGQYTSLEDPGVEISQDATEIHGITNNHVLGHRIDDEEVHALIDGATLIVAHYARFDREIIGKRFPKVLSSRWGCSCSNIPWKSYGHASASLSSLCRDYGFFYEGHRALNDVRAMMVLLQQSLTDKEGESRHLFTLLESLRQPKYYLTPGSTDYAGNSTLKQNGFRWDPKNKRWWIIVNGDHCFTEKAQFLASFCQVNGTGVVLSERVPLAALFDPSWEPRNLVRVYR